ncbi:MAG: BatA domain-containing protein [Kiritimatiellae bacterium]|nr:BatA domain-containing protein [Kiritimatiellia bacterium]
MHFLAPTFFAAFCALAAIPLIIYLIFRRRKRNVPWGAMFILRRTLDKHSRVKVWKQYAIIAVRTLAFLALPLAFMWPYLRWKPPTDGSFPPPPSSTHRLIILDVSPSMDAVYARGTCMDAAWSLCRKALAAGVFPGRLDILPMDGTETPFVFDRFPANHAAIESFLGQIGRNSTPANLETALRYALRTFRASHEKNKELYVFSDFGAKDVRDLNVLAGLFRSFRRQGARIFFLSYENPQLNNFAVLDFTAQMDLLLQGQPTMFYAVLGYFGAQPVAETWLTINNQDGETLYEEVLSLAPGEKTVTIPLTLKGKERMLTASVKKDDFSNDNAIQRGYRVSDSLRLLVIQGINLKSGFENPKEWLELVFAAPGEKSSLSPLQVSSESKPESSQSTKLGGRYQVHVDFASAVQINPAQFEDTDGIILLDVDSLSEAQVDALRLYVLRGGTVLLAPGPQTAPDKFNATFLPITPIGLEAPAQKEIDPDRYENAILEKTSDLMLKEIETPQHGNIGNARFYNYYRVDANKMAKGAEILFTLSNEAPLLFYRPLGRGACLLWTAGLGMDWNSMVVHPVFPVFFSRLFNIAAARRKFALNLAPGAPIIYRLAQGAGKETVIRRPDGRRVTLQAELVGGAWFARYDDTLMPGMYRLQPDPADESDFLTYTVREDKHESDYRPITKEQQQALEQASGARFCLSERDMFESVGAVYTGRPLASWLACALFFLLLLEAGLARRWFA